MLARHIKIADIKTPEACVEAIDALEGDPRNIRGEYAAWNSGYESFLKSEAQRKLSALKRRLIILDDERANPTPLPAP